MQKISLLIFTCFLSGCSFLSQDEILPLYTLKSGNVEPRRILSKSLAINIPLGEASLDTERIALTPSPYERDYLADGQWPDRLPKIMQEALVEGLSERWGGTYVSRSGTGLQEDYLLQTEIQDFSVHHLKTERPEVRLKIAFKVINLRKRTVLVGHVFSVKEPVCSLAMKGIVEAFNKGFHLLLQEAMPWVENAVLKESGLNSRNDKLSR